MKICVPKYGPETIAFYTRRGREARAEAAAEFFSALAARGRRVLTRRSAATAQQRADR